MFQPRESVLRGFGTRGKRRERVTANEQALKRQDAAAAITMAGILGGSLVGIAIGSHVRKPV